MPLSKRTVRKPPRQTAMEPTTAAGGRRPTPSREPGRPSKRPETGGELVDLAGVRFHALTLAANSGRVVVRDWMQGAFADLAANVTRWFTDLEVARLDGPGTANSPKLEGVITCVLPPKSRGTDYGDWIKPIGKLREPFWRAAVASGDVPDDAVRMLLTEWRAAVLGDRFSKTRPVTRAALLKLYLLRKGCPVEPHLDIDHKQPAYHLGRLLAVLADVQRTALGDVGAGVVQRYYARASTAPADALGPLIRLSNAHLNKIGGRLEVTLRDRIADILGRCRFEGELPPTTLSTVEQTLFALGFYQQIAHDRAEQKRKRDAKKSADTPDTSEEE